MLLVLETHQRKRKKELSKYLGLPLGPHVSVDLIPKSKKPEPLRFRTVFLENKGIYKNLNKTTERELICYPPLDEHLRPKMEKSHSCWPRTTNM